MGMGNSISLPEDPAYSVEDLHMSNGLTSVFIEVLALSGSILATTNREKELVIWLAQRDQACVGIGTVGFDIDEMPWKIDSFEAEKEFMLRTIASAMDGLGWERLNYEPNQEMVQRCLQQFELMISAFEKKSVDINNYLEWSEIEEGDDSPTIPYGYPKCDKHGVYLSCHGCILCNNS
ncbi:Uncharacterised protein [Paenibacillus macerans]|nr:Uncharacterised protein [Paenibacillus macerans]